METQESASLAVFDRSRDPADPDDPGRILEAVVESAGGRILTKPDVDAAREIRVVIWHGDNKDWDRLCAASRSGFVRIRCTKLGDGDAAGWVNEVVNGVVRLRVRMPFRHLGREDWETIVRAVTDEGEVSELLAGGGGAEVRRYFYRWAPEHTMALFVLCQGYLFAWLLARPVNGGGAGEGKVARSVESELRTQLEGVRGLLPEGDPEQRVSRVKGREYWQVFGPDSSEKKVREAVGRELGVLKLPRSVGKLIRRITSQTDQEIGLETVWVAYKELERQLSK